MANDVGLHHGSAQPTRALEQPWIVPNDPGYSYQPGRFAENLGSAACSELPQGYKFKSLRWTSPTCKVVEIVTLPKHGTLINEGHDAYGYKPVSGYLGKDSVQYIVEGVDGRRVLITLPIAVQTLEDAFSYNKPLLDSWPTTSAWNNLLPDYNGNDT